MEAFHKGLQKANRRPTFSTVGRLSGRPGATGPSTRPSSGFAPTASVATAAEAAAAAHQKGHASLATAATAAPRAPTPTLATPPEAAQVPRRDLGTGAAAEREGPRPQGPSLLQRGRVTVRQHRSCAWRHWRNMGPLPPITPDAWTIPPDSSRPSPCSCTWSSCHTRAR